jgi:ribosomal protein S18 acetylase RimI-like enzyme
MPSAIRSEVLVRPAEERDLERLGHFGCLLMSLHHRFDPDRFIPTGRNTPHAYASWLRGELGKPEIIMLVAEQARRVVGYTYAGLEGTDYMSLRGPAGVIYDIFVDPDHRRGGVGRELLKATVAELMKGSRQVVLSTAYRNDDAQKLFVAAGFRPTMVEFSLTDSGPAQTAS